jgi:hypothetical protein
LSPDCGGFTPTPSRAGLPDGFLFKPKIPIRVFFWWGLDWKKMMYFMVICNILQTFGTFFSGFGIVYREKSGNSVLETIFISSLTSWKLDWTLKWLLMTTSL